MGLNLVAKYYWIRAKRRAASLGAELRSLLIRLT